MGWQPIDTAPESEPILVWAPMLHRGNPSAEVVVLYRNGDEINYWTNGGANGGDNIWFEAEPTHWMPLPSPPKTEGEVT